MRGSTLFTATFIVQVAVLAAVDDRLGPPRSAVRLDDVVVVATTRERQLFDVPYTAYAVPKDQDLLRLTLDTRGLPENLRRVPGVMLQKTGHGMTSPYLRGVTGQRVVLVVDGVRLNNSVFREGPNQYWNTVNPLFYDRLDVLLGPASVLYGSDAIGGVVAARSMPEPRGAHGEGWKHHDSSGLFRYSSAEASFTEYIETALSYGSRLGLRLAIAHQDFGELRAGEGTRYRNTDYDQWGFNIRARWWFNDDHSVRVGYDHFAQNGVERVHRTTSYVPWHGTWLMDDDRRVYDHDRRAAFVRYEMRNGGTWLEEFDLGFSYQYMLEDYFADRRTARNRMEFRTTRVETLGLNLRLQSPSDFGTWTYGADLWYDIVSSYGHNVVNGAHVPRPQGQVGDDSNYLLAGLYVQNELPLGDRWELVSGLRYTYAHLNARKVNIPGVGLDSLTGHWDSITGSMRLLWHAVPGRLNVYAGVSQGFRAPNLSDATRDDDFGGGVERPTTDLDEERFTTIEVGFKQRWQRGHIQAAGYYTWQQDRIARFSQPTDTKRNIDDGYIQGIELSGEFGLAPAWTLFGHGQWQEGREKTYANRDITQPMERRPISRIAPLGGELGLRWQAPGGRVWLEGLVEAAARQDKLADAETTDNRFPPNGTPGYGVVSLRGGWHMHDNLSMAVALENIADKAYRIHGSGVNEPGRNFVVSLMARF